MLDRLNLVLKAVITACGRTSGWLLLILVATILTDVIGRNFFSSGSTQLQELEWHLNATIFLLALGYAYTKKAHVRIDVAAQRFTRRTKARIEIIGITAFLLPYCAALTVFGVDYLAVSFAYGEASASATGLPYRWILKGIMVFGFILLAMAGLSGIIDRLRLLQEPLGTDTSTQSPDPEASHGVGT